MSIRMRANKVSRRLQVVLAGSGDDGKETTGRLTYGNIAANATDEQLLTAAEDLASLQTWTAKQIVKVETTVLVR